MKILKIQNNKSENYEKTHTIIKQKVKANVEEYLNLKILCVEKESSI